MSNISLCTGTTFWSSVHLFRSTWLVCFGFVRNCWAISHKDMSKFLFSIVWGMCSRIRSGIAGICGILGSVCWWAYRLFFPVGLSCRGLSFNAGFHLCFLHGQCSWALIHSHVTFEDLSLWALCPFLFVVVFRDLFYLHRCRGWVCICESSCLQGLGEEWHYRQFWAALWVNELRYPGRAASAFEHWAVSPAHLLTS